MKKVSKERILNSNRTQKKKKQKAIKKYPRSSLEMKYLPLTR